MYMSSPSERMESVVCVVLYLLCVLSVSGRDLIFEGDRSMTPKNVSVTLGSNVTFVCLGSVRDTATWYKIPMPQYAAYIGNTGGKCTLRNEYYPSISLGRHKCTGGNYSITIYSIQYNDSGVWRCSINDKEKQPINVHVSAQQATTRSQTAQRTTALQRSSPAIPPSNGPISDKTTTPAENEPITDDRSEVPNVQLNMTAVIGGAVGGVIALVLIITIVAVVRRTRTHSRDEKKPTNDDRTEGRAGGQHNDFGAFEEDIGGQYAAIFDTKNPTPAKVVAENPMYESYGQEDGGDHVSDVYSVVQKPLKSQSSTNDGSKDPNPPVTEDNVADVYSVVQKPSKLQESGSVSDGTKDTQPSGSDEMGDVYSVVQKPAKG